jgi:hypothetical protein
MNRKSLYIALVTGLLASCGSGDKADVSVPIPAPVPTPVVEAVETVVETRPEDTLVTRLSGAKLAPFRSAGQFDVAVTGDGAIVTRKTSPSIEASDLFIPLGKELSDALVGQTVDIVVSAKHDENAELHISFFTSGAGNSGFQEFDLSPEFQDHVFTYKISNSETTGIDRIYFGVSSDDLGGDLYIRSIEIYKTANEQ